MDANLIADQHAVEEDTERAAILTAEIRLRLGNDAAGRWLAAIGDVAPSVFIGLAEALIALLDLDGQQSQEYHGEPDEYQFKAVMRGQYQNGGEDGK